MKRIIIYLGIIILMVGLVSSTYFPSYNNLSSNQLNVKNISGVSLIEGSDDYINLTGAMYLNSGKVGIGIDSASNKLTVIGDINSSVNISTPKLCLNGNCQSSWPSSSSNISLWYVNNGSDWVGAKASSTGVMQIDITSQSSDTAANSFTVGSDLTVDTDTLYVDSSNNRIGIGTVTPTTSMEIRDATTQLSLRSDDGESTVINMGDASDYNIGRIEYDNGNDGLFFRTNNSDKVVIKDDGTVGIGTVTPTELLTLKSKGVSTYPITTLASDGSTLFTVNEESGGDGRVEIKNNSGGTAISLHSDSSSYLLGGRLGIGTSVPNSDVHVIGTINVDAGRSDSSVGLRLGTAYSAGGLNLRGPRLVAYNNDGTGYRGFMITIADDLAATTNAINAMMIDNLGFVGINTTTPDEMLDVQGDIEVGTGTTGCVKDEDGTVIAGTCSSDIRLKDNINNMSKALEKVSSLTPVTFTWKNETQTRYGLIAQEVEEIIPELVEEDNNGYKRVKYDSELTMFVIKAISELKEENEILKEENRNIKDFLCEKYPEEKMCD